MARNFMCTKTDPVVETKAGKLRGFQLDGTYAFHGVKYADAKRFHQPTPVEPWEGIKNALAYGYVCPMLQQDQPSNELMVPHRYWPLDENCQYLNIWTQSVDKNAKKPVMVWLHGGGFAAGSSIEHIAYEGENMSKYGDVVVISLNHRLNILGYLDLSPFGEEYKNSGNAGNAGKDKDIRRGGKEKIQNKNKQRQQQVASAKRRQEERDKMQRLQFEVAKKQQLKVSIPDEINVGELASRMKKTAVEVIKQLIKLGVMASVSDVIDYDTAALVAMELHGLLPALETPYYTENYEGFYHLVAMRGETEQAELQYIIRDHDRAKFEARKAVMEKACAEIDRRYGAGTAALTLRDSYYNMKEKIAPCMFLIENAKKAMESVGVTPKVVPIRGGTDGARLSFEGLPCPNLCTGGENFHGRFEYIPADDMETITNLLAQLMWQLAE